MPGGRRMTHNPLAQDPVTKPEDPLRFNSRLAASAEAATRRPEFQASD
jgi:hypothetical protein